VGAVGNGGAKSKPSSGGVLPSRTAAFGDTVIRESRNCENQAAPVPGRGELPAHSLSNVILNSKLPPPLRMPLLVFTSAGDTTDFCPCISEVVKPGPHGYMALSKLKSMGIRFSMSVHFCLAHGIPLRSDLDQVFPLR
jgi:hypothetical protein